MQGEESEELANEVAGILTDGHQAEMQMAAAEAQYGEEASDQNADGEEGEAEGRPHCG